jgi:transcriptional antiterminator RfaH
MSSIAFPLRDGRELAPGNDGANLTMNPSGCISSEAIHKPLDVWRQTNWFAIHAKPRREGFASTGLSAVNIEILFPRVRVERLIRGAAQQGTKPLFPGYFFARFCPESSFELVKAARGVLRVVSSGRMPIPVHDKIVREIRDRIQEDGLIQIRPQALAPGIRVTIQSGPFEGMMGRVERELDDRKRVAIFLETLFHARVLIERRWIEAEAEAA